MPSVRDVSRQRVPTSTLITGHALTYPQSLQLGRECMLTLERRPRADTALQRVGVLADTHIPTKAPTLPPRVFEVFQNVTHILHAGDLVSLDVIDALEQLAPVVAVRGNMDRRPVRDALPELNTLTLDRWRIGVTHDPGTLIGYGALQALADAHHLDVVVYGHTHRPSIHWDGNRLFLNPGSPTDPLPAFLVKPTVALLTVARGTIEPEIVTLER